MWNACLIVHHKKKPGFRVVHNTTLFHRKNYSNISSALPWVFVCGIYPDKSLAQEALNDAFLKIFNQLPYEHKKLTSFKAWARKLIIHTAIDYFRKEKKHFYHNDHDIEDTSQQENFFDRESAEEIMRLLNLLPPVWKVVFNLYEIEGYNHEEIARMLQIPASSSRTYLTRAKQQLRVLISTHNRTIQ